MRYPVTQGVLKDTSSSCLRRCFCCSCILRPTGYLCCHRLGCVLESLRLVWQGPCDA